MATMTRPEDNLTETPRGHHAHIVWRRIGTQPPVTWYIDAALWEGRSASGDTYTLRTTRDGFRVWRQEAGSIYVHPLDRSESRTSVEAAWFAKGYDAALHPTAP